MNHAHKTSVTPEDMAMLAAKHDIPIETSEADARNLSPMQIGALNASSLAGIYKVPVDHIADAGKMVVQAPSDAEISKHAATVHLRIDSLCKAANMPGADYFDASSSFLIAVRDLLIALGHPHRIDAAIAAQPAKPVTTMIPQEWLEPGAVVPVTVDTVRLLLSALQQLTKNK